MKNGIKKDNTSGILLAMSESITGIKKNTESPILMIPNAKKAYPVC